MAVLVLKKRALLVAIICIVLLMFLYTLSLDSVYIDKNKSPEVDKFLLEEYIRKVSRNAYHESNVYRNSSDKISGYREIPDTRDESCNNLKYNLPRTAKVSVIIAFLNEPRSSLLRTITSIIKRTPSDLLKEIILIDDFSANESIGMDLSFLPFVKSFRNRRREGLIESRNIGAMMASGEYILFLDSHCEVNTGWLEPLIACLMKNPGLAVSPIIDSIHPDTFQYKKSASYLKGGFNWNLEFQWIPMSIEERESRPESHAPFMSPSFPGGVFMISKEWFFTLNRFNKNLEIWGGESIEMALKIWLCGGQIEVVPCSRIGHVFSDKHTFTFPNGKNVTHLRNSKIIAESWLDEYKEFFYSVMPDARDIPSAPNDEVRKIKVDLQCRSFSWYIQNIFKELKFPYNDYAAFGELKNGAKCLTALNSKVFLTDCSHFNRNEWMLHTQTGMLSTANGGCLTASKKTVSLKYCRDKRMQKWKRRGGQIIHNATGLCLENFLQESVGVSKCRRGAPSQLFSFSVEVQKL